MKARLFGSVLLSGGLVVGVVAAQEGEAADPGGGTATAPAPAQGQPTTTTTTVVPFGFPQPGTNLESHLGSSSHAMTDINQGDDFDFTTARTTGSVARGNPGAPGLVGSDLSESSGVYAVRQGDTLSKISQEVYGQPWMWPKLWSLNPQIQNPHWIYPGDQIRLSTATASGKPTQVRTLGSGGLIDRREDIPRDTVFLQRTGYLDDPATGIQGEIVGAEKPLQLLSEGQVVYLAIKPGTSVAVGSALTVFRESRKPPKVKGARQPPGMIVAIQGTVKVDYFDPKTQVARGTILESLDVIERGAKVGDVGRRFEVVPPRKATQDVNARILTSMYPLVFAGESQVVFIDRGTHDGLSPGNRLFVIRRGDTWRRTLPTAGAHARLRIKMDVEEDVATEAVPLHGNEQDFPEEVIGELRVVNAQQFSSYAIVVRSHGELEPGDRAIARSGF